MTLKCQLTLTVSAMLLVALCTGVSAQTADVKKAEPKQAAAKGGKCVLAGGEANMITQGLAEFMAKAALKNSISGMGAQPVGEIKLDCSQNGALQYCKAAQRACK